MVLHHGSSPGGAMVENPPPIWSALLLLSCSQEEASFSQLDLGGPTAVTHLAVVQPAGWPG